MFACRQTRASGPGVSGHSVDVAFTDRWGGVTTGAYATLDLTRERAGDSESLATNWTVLAEAFEVEGFVSMRQVHGAHVETVRSLDVPMPTCDALVTDAVGVALCVRVGDCVPLALADVTAGVAGVAHVGRPGLLAGTVAATVQAMTRLGAASIEAWVGPHVCGGCYEVPRHHARRRCTRRAGCCLLVYDVGHPLGRCRGSAVVAQLVRAGCTRINVAGGLYP